VSAASQPRPASGRSASGQIPCAASPLSDEPRPATGHSGVYPDETSPRDDMNRGNSLQLGHFRVLRFPAWVVRYQPDYVAAQIRQALCDADYSC
jgi:hypothetical protein